MIYNTKNNATSYKLHATRSGFVLLFSLLIATIVLSVSLGAYNIVIKQLALSTTGRESQIAFYAADTGLECALYWDIRRRAFDSPSYVIECLGSSIPGTVDPVASTTYFTMNLDNGSCVDVAIDKSSGTQIESFGHNTCVSGASYRLERSLRLTY